MALTGLQWLTIEEGDGGGGAVGRGWLFISLHALKIRVIRWHVNKRSWQMAAGAPGCYLLTTYHH